MTRVAQKVKVSLKFAPAAQKPTLEDFENGNLQWFRCPKVYLHMVENHNALKEGVADEQEPTRDSGLPVRPVALEEGAAAAAVRAPSERDDQHSSSGSSRGSETTCSSDESDERSDSSGSETEQECSPSPKRPRRTTTTTATTSPTAASAESLRSAREQQPPAPDAVPPPLQYQQVPHVVEEEVDRDGITLRLNNMRNIAPVNIPSDLTHVPIHELRDLYTRNQRTVRINTLVQWYSAGLLAAFVFVDAAADNLFGMEMDHYVEIQTANLAHYRHYLYKIAEKQVKAAGSSGGGGGIVSDGNPYVAISIIFAVTTVAYIAVRLVLRHKSGKLFLNLLPLLGSLAPPAAPPGGAPGGVGRGDFSPTALFSNVLSTMMNSSGSAAQTGQQQRMRTPEEFGATPAR
jgi:hypothetical protein